MSQTYRRYMGVAAWVVVTAGAALLPGAARAAETVHLYLKANGVNIQGESSQHSLGRENSIECISFTQAASAPRDAGSGLASGKRQYEPIVIRKRVDKSSPLLMKALTQNQVLEADFKFFRPNPNGDGTTEQFYTVHIGKARLVSYKLFVPDCLDPASANLPPLEEIGFAFQTISWTYTNGGITHEDTWGASRDLEESGIQERGVEGAPKK